MLCSNVEFYFRRFFISTQILNEVFVFKHFVLFRNKRIFSSLFVSSQSRFIHNNNKKSRNVEWKNCHFGSPSTATHLHISHLHICANKIVLKIMSHNYKWVYWCVQFVLFQWHWEENNKNFGSTNRWIHRAIIMSLCVTLSVI